MLQRTENSHLAQLQGSLQDQFTIAYAEANAACTAPNNKKSLVEELPKTAMELALGGIDTSKFLNEADETELGYDDEAEGMPSVVPHVFSMLLSNGMVRSDWIIPAIDNPDAPSIVDKAISNLRDLRQLADCFRDVGISAVCFNAPPEEFYLDGVAELKGAQVFYFQPRLK